MQPLIILNILEDTTLTGWVITALLGVVVYFLQRFVKSVDKLEDSVSKIGNAIVEHKTIVDGHEERLERIEDKVFPTR